jgi:hypothetical protein
VPQARRLDRLLTAIAIDGKWLRGAADGQVKLFVGFTNRAALQNQGDLVLCGRPCSLDGYGT